MSQILPPEDHILHTVLTSNLADSTWHQLKAKVTAAGTIFLIGRDLTGCNFRLREGFMQLLIWAFHYKY